MIFQEESQVIERVKKPLNSEEVSKGRRYESRLRLFTEIKFEETIKKEEAYIELIRSMDARLTKEKSESIKKYIQYPLSSVNITESLMSDLYKVFDAGNSFFNVEAIKKDGGEKVEEVFRNLNLNSWIERQGKRVLRNKPNTIVVVDKDEKGEPYLLAIDNDRLIDLELKQNGIDLEYITFLHSEVKGEDGTIERRVSVYDEETYYVVLKKGETYTIETSQQHNIGYCPARMFINEMLSSSEWFDRKIPLSSALSKLTEWQLFDTYKFYTDHYAPFPIVEMVKAKCGNEDCNNGTIELKSYYTDNGVEKHRSTYTSCPTCESNNKIGVGTVLLLDPIEEDEKSASGMFRMISPDVSNLEYLQKKLDEIENYIKLKVVGIDNTITSTAINEKQVQGSFESRTNVLLNLKTNLDDLYVWIAKTVGKTIIKDKELHISANFGTEWYLVGEDQLQERYKNALEIGLPIEEVDMIYNQLVETKYKGNSSKISKLKIVNELNPLSYISSEQKINKLANGVISKKEFLFSERLTIFVDRFEKENGSIVEFGEEIDYSEKIKKIVEQINKYTDEYIKENETEQIIGS